MPASSGGAFCLYRPGRAPASRQRQRGKGHFSDSKLESLRIEGGKDVASMTEPGKSFARSKFDENASRKRPYIGLCMTVSEEFSRRGCCWGFNWLRLALALGIFTFHSVTISYGSAASIPPVLLVFARLILPMFFALSGFLIAASLARSPSLAQFITFRALRLLPPLMIIVLTSMFILGPLFTTESWRAYFSERGFINYLANIAAQPRYGLPGVFTHNARPGVVNGSLWTIPVELWCYLGMAPVFILGLIKKPIPLAISALILLFVLTVGFCSGCAWAGKLPTGDLLLPFLAGVTMFAAAKRIPSRGFLAIVLFGTALLLSLYARWSVVAALPLAYVTVWLGMRSWPALPGDYSYGLYLAGYPVQQSFIALFQGAPWWHTWLVCLPIAFGSAVLLWHFIEKPVLTQKYRLFRRFSLSFPPRQDSLLRAKLYKFIVSYTGVTRGLLQRKRLSRVDVDGAERNEGALASS
jgi:peptidoglycan/LPS O-acetylase OafA/YrhL